jgi:hypothetical protein
MSPPARLVICGLVELVVVDPMVIPDVVAAGAVIDVVSAVIDAEPYASGVRVSLCSVNDEGEDDAVVVVEEVEVRSKLVAAVVVEPIVLPPPTAVAAPPALAGKTDKSLSAHATDTP